MDLDLDGVAWDECLREWMCARSGDVSVGGGTEIWPSLETTSSAMGSMEPFSELEADRRLDGFCAGLDVILGFSVGQTERAMAALPDYGRWERKQASVLSGR